MTKWRDIMTDENYTSATPESKRKIQDMWYDKNVKQDENYVKEDDTKIRSAIFGWEEVARSDKNIQKWYKELREDHPEEPEDVVTHMKRSMVDLKGFNYQKSIESGQLPTVRDPEDGKLHWFGDVKETGEILKGPEHPTIDKTLGSYKGMSKEELQELGVDFPGDTPRTAQFPAGQTEISALPDLTALEKVKDTIIKPFIKGTQQRKFEAWDKLRLAERLKAPLSYVDKNYKAIKDNPEMYGFQFGPDVNDLISFGFMGAIGAGALTAPVATAISVGIFAGITEMENAAVSFITQTDYTPGAGKGLKELVQNYSTKEFNENTDLAFDMVDLILKGKVIKGIKDKAPQAVENMTKKVVEKYNLPKEIYIPAEKVRDIFQTGKKIAPEEEALIKELNLTSEGYRRALKDGINIRVPIEKVVTMSDKPWFAKVKSIFKMDPTPETIKFNRAATISEGPKGFLDAPVTEIPVATPEVPGDKVPTVSIGGTPKDGGGFEKELSKAMKQPYEMTKKEFAEIPIIKHIRQRLSDKEVPMKVKERNQLAQQLLDSGIMSVDDFNAITGQHGFGGVSGVSNITTGKPIPSKPIDLDSDMGARLSYIGQWHAFRVASDWFAHSHQISKALEEGKFVPTNVLEEYRGVNNGDADTGWADRELFKRKYEKQGIALEKKESVRDGKDKVMYIAKNKSGKVIARSDVMAWNRESEAIKQIENDITKLSPSADPLPEIIGKELVGDETGILDTGGILAGIKDFIKTHSIWMFGDIKNLDPQLAEELMTRYHEWVTSLNRAIIEVDKIKSAKGLTLNERIQVSYGREEIDYKVSSKLEGIVREFIKFFDDLERLNIEHGTFKMGFIEGRKISNIEKLLELRQKIKTNLGDPKKKAAVTRWRNEMKGLEAEQRVLDNSRFLPHGSVARAVIEAKIAKLPAWQRKKFFNKVMRLSFKYPKRKGIIPIRYYVEQGILNPDEADIVRLAMAALGETNMRLAMKALWDYGRDNGLIVHKNNKDPKYELWNALNPVQHGIIAPEHANYRIHPLFEKGLMQLKEATGRSSNPFKTFLSMVKQGQFYNPTIIWKYNIIQSALGGSLGLKTPIYLANAMVSYFNKGVDYVEAERLGVFQRAYLPGINSKVGRDQIAIAARQTLRDVPGVVKLLEQLTGMTMTKQNTTRLLMAVYRAIGNVTWSGDEIQRLTSYLAYKDMGYDPKESAYLASTWHGAYAEVSPRLRNIASNFLFVYSFRFLMPRQLWRAIYEPTKMALDTIAFKSTDGKYGRKYPQRDWKRTIKGISAMIALPLLYHWYMKRRGYKTEVATWKYSKQVGDKEIVVASNYIVNQQIKQAYRLLAARTDPTKPVPAAFQRIYGFLKWEIHPVYRLADDCVTNRRSFGGGKVYDEIDSNNTKIRKCFGYFITGSFRVLDLLQPNDDEVKPGQNSYRLTKAEQVSLMNDSMTALERGITAATGYRYVRSSSDTYYRINISQLQKAARKIAYRYAREGRDVKEVEKWYNVVKDEIDRRYGKGKYESKK